VLWLWVNVSIFSFVSCRLEQSMNKVWDFIYTKHLTRDEHWEGKGAVIETHSVDRSYIFYPKSYHRGKLPYSLIQGHSSSHQENTFLSTVPNYAGVKSRLAFFFLLMFLILTNLLTY
jgi:hypothetical protein